MKSPAWIFWLFLIANLVFLLALGAHLALDYRSLHSVEKWVADGQEDSRDAELVEQARAMLADDQATEQERHIAGMVLASVSANALRKDELLDQLGSGGGLLRHGLVMLATLLVFSGTLVLLARARRRDRLNTLRHDEAVGSFNYLLEKAPLAFVAWNNERGVLLWNEDAERLFGVRRNNVLGAPMPASAKGVAIAVEEAMTEGSSAVTMELDLGARQDLSMVVAVVATRMQSADGTPTYSAVIEDLTTQRQQAQRNTAPGLIFRSADRDVTDRITVTGYRLDALRVIADDDLRPDGAVFQLKICQKQFQCGTPFRLVDHGNPRIVPADSIPARDVAGEDIGNLLPAERNNRIARVHNQTDAIQRDGIRMQILFTRLQRARHHANIRDAFAYIVDAAR